MNSKANPYKPEKHYESVLMPFLDHPHAWGLGLPRLFALVNDAA